MKPDDLERIRAGLEAASEVLQSFSRATVERSCKQGGDPVTAADVAVNEVLRRMLPRNGDGWLSEETADDPDRLNCRRVWVVDPLDGTREFLEGIPEWAVSIGLVEDNQAVAGGVFNPATGEVVLGAVGLGVTLNGGSARASARQGMAGAEVLASRNEARRGEWERFRSAPFRFQPVGSVAYKLSRVAAGLADATWTLCPKHEWDVAGGVALVRAAGGFSCGLDGGPLRFNQAEPKLAGMIATAPGMAGAVVAYLGLGREATARE